MEQLKNSLFGISVLASPTALSSTLWYFGSHICPHALCTFSKSKWSANKGGPPLKDPAVQLSQCSHVKPKQGCTVTACCTYKIKTANSLIHHFNRIQWIRPNRFNYGITRSPSRTYIAYLCTYICAIHCTESKPSLSGAWGGAKSHCTDSHRDVSSADQTFRNTEIIGGRLQRPQTLSIW